MAEPTEVEPSDEASRGHKPKTRRVRILVVTVVTIMALISGLGAYMLTFWTMGGSGVTGYVSVGCVEGTKQAHFECQITGMDSSVDPTRLTVQIISVKGEVLGSWQAPIRFESPGSSLPVSSPASPLDSATRIVDSSDGIFGAGDRILIELSAPDKLTSIDIKVTGGGAWGVSQFRRIILECGPVLANSSTICAIRDAPPDVKFKEVFILVINPDGNKATAWRPGVEFPGPGGRVKGEWLGPMGNAVGENSSLIDDGDGVLGIADSIELLPSAGRTLDGVAIRFDWPLGSLGQVVLH